MGVLPELGPSLKRYFSRLHVILHVLSSKAQANDVKHEQVTCKMSM